MSMTTCPHCKTMVHEDVAVCPNCDTRLKPRPLLLWGVVVGLIVLALVLAFAL